MVDLIRVEVAYAEPEQQWLLEVSLEPGSTVEAAIRRSGLTEQIEMDLESHNWAVGVFGHTCDLKTVLQEGDRVEIYRPLHLHPMQARRARLSNKTN